MKYSASSRVMILLVICAYSLAVKGTHEECIIRKKQAITVGHILQLVLRGSTTIILFENTNDTFWSNVKDLIDDQHVVTSISMAHARVFLFRHLQNVLRTSSSIEDIRNTLKFIVFCNDCFQWLTKMVSTLDESIGLQTMRHFSTWFFLTTCPVTLLDYHNVHLDNLAVATMENCMKQSEKRKNHFHSDLMTVHIQELATLEWTPTGRWWTRVNLHVCNKTKEDTLAVIFPNIKRGLNGRQLSVAILQWHPWSIRKGVGKNSTFVGTTVDIINILAKTYNFTYRFVEPEDGSWGSKTKNGTWTGIIGMVSKQMTDMTGGPYGITTSRAQVMDYSVPVDALETIGFYALKEENTNALFQDNYFEWRVYVAAAAAIVCATCIYVGITYLHPRDGGSRNNGEKIIGDLLLLIGVAIPLRQDMASLHSPQTWSTRVFIFFWCLFCLLMATIYSGRLVALATVETREFPFNTLQELADQDEHRVVSLEGSIIQNFLNTSKSEIYQKLNKKLQNNLISVTDQYWQEGLDLLLNNKVVLLVGTDAFYMVRANSCQLHVMKEKLLSTYTAFAYPRGSPLTKLFDQTYATLVETDVVKVMKRKWFPKPKLCVEHKYGTNQFKLSHLLTTFSLCADGVALATLIMLLERWKAGRITCNFRC